MVKLTSWIIIGLMLVQNEIPSVVSGHNAVISNRSARILALLTLPVMLFVAAGFLAFFENGPVGSMFLRGAILFGLPILVACFFMNNSRVIFTAIYAFSSIVIVTFVLSLILVVILPAIGWWLTGNFSTTGFEKKVELSAIVSVLVTPFFTIYALFAATDEEVATNITPLWIGKVFLKILIKPATLFITLLGALFGASQLFIKVVTTTDPLIQQIMPWQ